VMEERPFILTMDRLAAAELALAMMEASAAIEAVWLAGVAAGGLLRLGLLGLMRPHQEVLEVLA
jgi:hypothetical protein